VKTYSSTPQIQNQDFVKGHNKNNCHKRQLTVTMLAYYVMLHLQVFVPNSDILTKFV